MLRDDAKPDEAWPRVAGHWRRQMEGLETAAPYGFATRTMARWREWRAQEWVRRWERYSLCGAAAACTVALATGAWTYWQLGGAGDEPLVAPPSMMEALELWEA